MLVANVSTGAANIKRLLDACPQVSAEADQRLQEALLNSVDSNIVVVAKSLAPKKTGALQASIRVQPGETPMSVLMIADKFYAPFLEYGTRYIPEGKFSFLRPAIAMQLDKVIEDVANSLIEQLGQL